MPTLTQVFQTIAPDLPLWDCAFCRHGIATGDEYEGQPICFHCIHDRWPNRIKRECDKCDEQLDMPVRWDVDAWPSCRLCGMRELTDEYKARSLRRYYQARIQRGL